MTIDTHQHFWKYDPVAYDWISSDMAGIRKDFLPADLHREISSAGVDGVISVQARQSIAETKWLLQLADTYPFIKGVTAWLPLADAHAGALLEKYAVNPYLKACRHLLQGEADDYMFHEGFSRGIDLLAHHQLIYEILVYERQLPSVIRFVDLHPGQVFVLDHMAKPCVSKNEMSPWRENIRLLAERPQVHCKLSGIVTEASYDNWTVEHLKPYMDTVLEAFRPDRLRYGSDWPVCLLACTYGHWLSLVKSFISALSEAEQMKILGANAVKLYRLEM